MRIPDMVTLKKNSTMKTLVNILSKYQTWAIALTTLLLASACNVLDKEPLDVIPETIVWNDEKLVDAYLTGAYLNTTVLHNEADDVHNSGKPFFSIFYVNNVSDESKSTSNFSGNAYQYKVNGLKINGGLLEYWERPYKVIRTLNEIIENLPASAVSETFKTQTIAEARFLRAFNYFYMVKRYGGLPLIKKVQKDTDPQEELYPKRNTEQEVYDFVISEANAILADLPEIDDTNWGRPSRYAALALISRAALYAGSIAEFGVVDLDGVVGIERSQATRYYEESLQASAQIINEGGFQLYNANADKTANFRELFLTKRNSEVIYALQHDGSDKDFAGAGWAYDYFQCPFPNGWANGIHDAPYLEFAEAFEYIDGRPGTIDFQALSGQLITTQQLWEGKDPRFLATVYTQDTPWQGRNLDFYNGIRREDGTILTTGSYNGVLANGDQKVTQTGFGVLKYLDEKKDNGNSSSAGIFGSTTDFIIFRYAEILLNHAEAAFALGRQAEALEAINQVRDRAGISMLTAVDLGRIQNERRVELAFEGHRYWDLRRWRIAEDYLSRNQSGLRYILDYTTRKFLVEKRVNTDGAVNPPIFEAHNYYFPITLARTANNPNLVENPGYR